MTSFISRRKQVSFSSRASGSPTREYSPSSSTLSSSSRLSQEEIEEIINSPYDTGYTYTDSAAYHLNGSEEFRHPQLCRRINQLVDASILRQHQRRLREANVSFFQRASGVLTHAAHSVGHTLAAICWALYAGVREPFFLLAALIFWLSSTTKYALIYVCSKICHLFIVAGEDFLVGGRLLAYGASRLVAWTYASFAALYSSFVGAVVHWLFTAGSTRTLHHYDYGQSQKTSAGVQFRDEDVAAANLAGPSGGSLIRENITKHSVNAACDLNNLSVNFDDDADDDDEVVEMPRFSPPADNKIFRRNRHYVNESYSYGYQTQQFNHSPPAAKNNMHVFGAFIAIVYHAFAFVFINPFVWLGTALVWIFTGGFLRRANFTTNDGNATNFDAPPTTPYNLRRTTMIHHHQLQQQGTRPLRQSPQSFPLTSGCVRSRAVAAAARGTAAFGVASKQAFLQTLAVIASVATALSAPFVWLVGALFWLIGGEYFCRAYISTASAIDDTWRFSFFTPRFTSTPLGDVTNEVPKGTRRNGKSSTAATLRKNNNDIPQSVGWRRAGRLCGLVTPLFLTWLGVALAVLAALFIFTQNYGNPLMVPVTQPPIAPLSGTDGDGANASSLLAEFLAQIDALRSELRDAVRQIRAEHEHTVSRLSEVERAERYERLLEELTSRQERVVDEMTRRVLAEMRFVERTQQQIQNLDDIRADDNDALMSRVRALIREQLRVYDADKTGLADYALESSGASIASIRCTIAYNERSRTQKYFGIPLWFSSYSPRSVIQHKGGTSAGECWAFVGPHGYLTIRLSGRVDVTAVSYEHLPVELSPDGHIRTAPRDFLVYSYQDVDDLESRYLLGNFTYDNHGEPLQMFRIQSQDPKGTPVIELETLSNYGATVTCLYRFRVHGSLHPSNQPTF